MKPRLLLIEDCEATRFGLTSYFSNEGYLLSEADSLNGATRLMAVQQFDAIIIDVNLPDGNGLDFISSIREEPNFVPIIVITGAPDIPLAVEAMQRGADNFLTKPVDMAVLAVSMRKLLEVGTLKRQSIARKRLEKQQGFFWGGDAGILEIQQLALAAARSVHPVLITGETGTGKGMLAKWIHQQSERAGYEFVELNCSSLRGEMLARELFGAQRGAYTSADKDRQGLLDIADHGTLFLDEIGDMSIDVQAQFLKLLEDKNYRRLGDTKLRKSDFRLISATHRNLQAYCSNESFRHDLLYRINLIEIQLPALRHRKKDLPEIVSHMLQQLGGEDRIIPPQVLDIFLAYHWPGNFRELHNLLERALLLTPPGATFRQSIFSCLASKRTPQPSALSSLSPSTQVVTKTVQEVEEDHILSVLKQHSGNVELAAKTLNVSRATLYRRLKVLRERTK